MPRQPFHRRLQGLFWDRSQLLRRPLKKLRRQLSVAAYRWRNRGPGGEAPRVLPQATIAQPLPHPAISIASNGDEAAIQTFLAGQSETSVAIEAEAKDAPYCLPAPPLTDLLPATWLESLLLVAATEDLSFARAGFAAPAPGPHGPTGDLHLPREAHPATYTLLRLPQAGKNAPEPVLGRAVPQLSDGDELNLRLAADSPLLNRSGPYILRPEVAPGQVLRQPLRRPDKILANLPAVPGPPTVLFLLPFLAIGGAEHLLYDLLEGLCPDYRCLVVTFEPHLAERGQSVERCRRYTPQVYTLGDWLPREAHLGALLHLIRRYRVDSLVCWNGTVDFYDGLAEIKATFPKLRVLSQHFNHRGAWIERIGPEQVRNIDGHLAVNRPIARALEKERGVPAAAIHLVHHGVALPEILGEEEQSERRRQARQRFGLPPEAVVAGTFVRLHAQKRPMDVLHLARRLAARDLWFLLAGGGPLDDEIDRELAERPIRNLIRLPMQDDIEPLYDAIDLCLSTSAYEGLPVFLLDGLARGLPVVSTAVGDIPHLLAEGGGLLAHSPGHLDQLEEALQRLRDSGLRRREGTKGRRRVAEYFSLEPYRQRYREAIFPTAKDGVVEDPAAKDPIAEDSAP